MTTVAALQSTDVTKVGIGTILVLLVVGILVFVAVSAIIGRIIVVLVVVGLGLLVWQQRSTVLDHINKCDLKTSFLGIDIQAPDRVVNTCHRGNP